ncbi:DUF402 domain-containing protein [Nocardioides sp. SYSU DS0651]|uniref:DUF402 domain-containing protein n=1 Tax=Nocardioides sp. SYSU DS0651 TaxID=3415955 RepID=UPI003F4C4396
MTPGDPIRVVMTKWGDRPHWEYDGTFLGSDAYGDWLGFPLGTHYRRPGLEFVAEFAGVVVVPTGGAAHVAAFNDAKATHRVYVDITTRPAWDGSVLRAVDLDLDVVMLQDGTVYLDDADEFAEHRVAYGYPPEVVRSAEESAARVLAAVRDGEPPFDGTAERWLHLLG